MAIEGTSTHVRALRLCGYGVLFDVRFVGLSEGTDCATVLHKKPRVLVKQPEEVYEQSTLWDTRPAADDTAVNVLARVTREVRQGNPDSILYDRHLLKHFSHSTRLFQHRLVSMDVPDKAAIAQLDREVAIRATELTDRTPSPDKSGSSVTWT